MFIGIDFGTCNSSAALAIDNQIQLVKEPVKQGYSFPSSVYLTEEGEILVGQIAENRKFLDVTRYRREFKRDLLENTPYFLGSQGEYQFTPQELIAEVIKNLKREANKITTSLGKEDITRAIITIPAGYKKNKKDLMKQAALKAGFTSVYLLEEPVAAAVYYHYRKPANFKENDVILIYDLGGGTFDATLVRKTSKSFQILGEPIGLDNCGGVDFNRAIFEHLVESLSPEIQKELTSRSNNQRSLYLDFCRDIKHQFSSYTSAAGQIPISGQPYQLTSSDFERMISSYVEQTLDICENLIRSTGLKTQDITRIVLAGGSCRIPYIRESIENRLEASTSLIDEPELAICQGAAIFGSEHSIKVTEIRQLFVNRLDRLAQVIANFKRQVAAEVSQALAIANFANEVNEEGSRLKYKSANRNRLNNTIKVLIFGHFNRGKSTILNAFLEQELLPMGATPTTAIPTFVKYGNQKKVVVHKKNGKIEELSVDEYKKKYTLNSNEARNQIGLNKPFKKVGDWLAPLDHAEFYYPNEVLSRGVEFIDIAGLNHTDEENLKTFTYIEQCHAILFVLAADQQFTQVERYYLKKLFGIKQAIKNQSQIPPLSTLKKKQTRPVFCLINKWDCIEESQKEEVYEYFVDIFSKLFNLDFDEFKQMWGDTIFDVSAKTALENLRQGKSLDGTGLKEIQRRLDDFLINEGLINDSLFTGRNHEQIQEKLVSDIQRAVDVAKCIKVEVDSRVSNLLFFLQVFSSCLSNIDIEKEKEKIKSFQADIEIELDIMQKELDQLLSSESFIV